MKPRIFIFCRPYLVADFRENVAPLSGEFEFSFLTDGRCPGTPDTRADFYEALRTRVTCTELTSADEKNVRLRCRLLRNIDREQALALMHAMASVICRKLDELRPRAILSHLVDEYIIHLVALLAAKRDIRFVNYFASYFPGRVQLTQHAHGVAFDVYEPDDGEVDQALNLVQQPRFRQNYNQRANYTASRHLFNVCRYNVKRLVFFMKGAVQRDPWNLHYRVTPHVAERRRWQDFPAQRDFHDRWQDRLERSAAERGGPTVYLPLAYFPEATTDYWVLNTRIIEYERRVLEMVNALAGGRDGTVVVKEHLHMMGARNRKLYTALMEIPNVISVHPMEYSNEVLDRCDGVVMGSGSVGIEATVRGKPVFSYCNTSYWFDASHAVFLDLDCIDSWGDVVRKELIKYRPNSPAENKAFIRDCLRSNVLARGSGRIWPLIDVAALRTALEQGAVPLRRVSSDDAYLLKSIPTRL